VHEGISLKFGVLNSAISLIDLEDLERSELSAIEDEHGYDAWINSNGSKLYVETRAGKSLELAWDSTTILNRLKTIGKNQPLLKSINVEKTTTVIDLTFGLGVDTLCLLKMGLTVTAVERNPLLYLLGKHEIDRLKRVVDFEFLNQLTLEFGDSKVAMKNNKPFDAVYYDPMYPSKNKSALPKKELQVLGEICSAGDEFIQVLEAFDKSQSKRLVVKRPHYLPKHDSTSYSVESKLVRYDVYIGPPS